MSFDGAGLGLEGQELVYSHWRAMTRGRPFALRADIDQSRMIGELAHVSIVAREAEGFRYRIAGSGLRQTFARDARGLLVNEIPACTGLPAWEEGLRRCAAEARPVIGRSRTMDGQVHYWMRLPLSSDGVRVDQVLCHDRILPMDSLSDPELAAKAADRALRLDIDELCAA
jgi:hypothetical protein